MTKDFEWKFFSPLSPASVHLDYETPALWLHTRREKLTFAMKTNSRIWDKDRDELECLKIKFMANFSEKCSSLWVWLIRTMCARIMQVWIRIYLNCLIFSTGLNLWYCRSTDCKNETRVNNIGNLSPTVNFNWKLYRRLKS